MKEILRRLYQHDTLSQEEAADIMYKISNGEYNTSQISSFLTVFNMRAITIAELSGFRQTLIELSNKIDLDGRQSIDLCGTGGDGKDTFNISTTSSFVVAGAGVPVTKHGNHGVSSSCGSSTVLEHLGIKFSNDQDELLDSLDKNNLCFFHAPLFHPALKAVGPIRRELGVKTFFNMLGPLVNPAQPTHQLVGVFNLRLAKLYQYLLEESSSDFQILHGLSGFDEISLTDDVMSITRGTEDVFSPKDLMFDKIQLSQIKGGATVTDSAKILLGVLTNTATEAQKNVVLANSAKAIQLFKNISYEDALAEANESIKSGRAYSILKALAA